MQLYLFIIVFSNNKTLRFHLAQASHNAILLIGSILGPFLDKLNNTIRTYNFLLLFIITVIGLNFVVIFVIT
jgi:hypothetical protein